MIEQIEAAIIAKLKPALGGLLVDSFPDTQEKYNRLPFNKGVCLVAYKGSRFGEVKATDLIIQDQAAEFEVQVAVRNLKGQAGAYALLEAVRGALTGYAPGGAGQLFPTNEQFVSSEDFVWTYAQTFTCSWPAVQVVPDSTDPPFQHGIFQDDHSGELTEVPIV